jgi:hypothetical protein
MKSAHFRNFVSVPLNIDIYSNFSACSKIVIIDKFYINNFILYHVKKIQLLNMILLNIV